MGTTAVTSLLGFVFWIVAARRLSATEVGRAAALVSAMVFVSVFTNLGLGQVFVSRLASRAPGKDWSLTVTTGLALVAVVEPGRRRDRGGAAADPDPGAEGRAPDPAAFLLLPLGVAGVACSLVPRLRLHRRAPREARLRPQHCRGGAADVAAIGWPPLGPLDGTTWILASGSARSC